jgi:hypothetical protein
LPSGVVAGGFVQIARRDRRRGSTASRAGCDGEDALARSPACVSMRVWRSTHTLRRLSWLARSCPDRAWSRGSGPTVVAASFCSAGSPRTPRPGSQFVSASSDCCHIAGVSGVVEVDLMHGIDVTAMHHRDRLPERFEEHRPRSAVAYRLLRSFSEADARRPSRSDHRPRGRHRSRHEALLADSVGLAPLVVLESCPRPCGWRSPCTTCSPRRTSRRSRGTHRWPSPSWADARPSP